MTGSFPIDPLRGVDSDLTAKPAKAKQEPQDGPSFAEFLKDSISEVNQLKQQADAAINDLALGRTENVSEVFTAVEKADIAFQALMAIRNKLVDAYQEINRLRV